MIATWGLSITLLEVPIGSFMARATVPENGLDPWSSTDLLTICQPPLVKPMPPKETKPKNCLAVGSRDEPEALAVGMRPSEPGGTLVTVEMGWPRCDWELNRVATWRNSTGR